MVVKPTRSANRTETRRRSATGTSVLAGFAVVVAAAAPSCVPQSPQKRWPGGLTAPQLGHAASSEVPQLPQNRLPVGFSVPQLGQVNAGLQGGKARAYNGPLGRGRAPNRDQSSSR